MTKQEIIDKINTGIRGQGSMVDIGGVLADVLTELVEGVDTLEYSRTHPNLQIEISNDASNIVDSTETETAEILNIKVEDLRRLMKYGGFVSLNGELVSEFEDLVAIVIQDTDTEAPDRKMDFFIKNSTNDAPSIRFYLVQRNGLYTFGEV